MRRFCPFFIFVFVFFLSGCRVDVELSTKGNSATGRATVKLEPFLVTYWKDLSVKPDTPVFDIERIKAIDAQYEAMDIVSADIVSEESIVLDFLIKDFSLLSQEVSRISGKDAFKIADNNFIVDADRELVLWFMSMILGDITTAEGFLPPEDISEEESAEYFTWVFEDYASTDEVLAMLKNTGLNLNIAPKEKSTWIPFMPVISGKQKTYKISLAQ